MIPVYIIYTLLFLHSLFIALSILYFKNISSFLIKIMSSQDSREELDHDDFKYIVKKIIKLEEEMIGTKSEILYQISDMRKEWDMESLKINILQQGRGNSRNWEKWQTAFGGKVKEVKK